MYSITGFATALLLILALFFDPSYYVNDASGIQKLETHLHGCFHHPHRRRRR